MAGQAFLGAFPSAEELEGRIGPEAGVVVGVLVAGDEGEEALKEEHRGLVGDLGCIAAVGEQPGRSFGPTQPVAQFPQGPKTAIAGELAA